MLLASDVPDAWKRHQLKSVGRQLRHWTKKVRQSFGAPVSGVGGTGPPETLTGEDDFDAGPVQAWLTQLVKTAQGIERSASTGGPSTPGRKPPVPPKPNITPSAKKKLRFTLEVSTAELAKELPFSEELSDKPWEGSALTSAVKRNLRKKEATVAKKKGKTIAKKSLDWKVENTVMGRTQRSRRQRGRSTRRRQRSERGASYLTFKSYWPRRAWSFFGPVISIWDLGPIWKNDWPAVTQASTG